MLRRLLVPSLAEVRVFRSSASIAWIPPYLIPFLRKDGHPSLITGILVQGPSNYKGWSRKMVLILEDAILWDHS